MSSRDVSGHNTGRKFAGDEASYNRRVAAALTSSMDGELHTLSVCFISTIAQRNFGKNCRLVASLIQVLHGAKQRWFPVSAVDDNTPVPSCLTGNLGMFFLPIPKECW